MTPYFYITIPNSPNGIAHITYEKLIEGNKTACGRIMQKGWKWHKPGRKSHFKKRCKRCMRVG
jgi:hypothetical protein